MPTHGVKIVADECMPEDFDWAFAKRHDGSMVLILTRSASGCERTLSEAWAAYRCMEQATESQPARELSLDGSPGCQAS